MFSVYSQSSFTVLALYYKFIDFNHMIFSTGEEKVTFISIRYYFAVGESCKIFSQYDF